MGRDPQIENLFEALHEGELIALVNNWPLAMSFRLEPGAVVVVAGCYKGAVMDLLAHLYPGITIHGFDPQPWALKIASDRLFNRRPVNMLHPTTFYLHNFGLWTETTEMLMGEWETDAASILRPDGRTFGTGNFKAFDEAMQECGIGGIDLAVINMEGAEYILIEHMERSGAINRIDRLAIQWHTGLAGRTHEEDMVDVDFHVDRRFVNAGLGLVYDERPTWTYSERRRDA